MNMNSLFDNLSKEDNKAVYTVESIEDIEKIPIRDSATLNQLLYKNEKYNKRDIPVNVEKKPLHELIKNKNTTMSELNNMIDVDIENLLTKHWFQIPIKLKKNLINDYCKNNNLKLNDETLAKVLRNRTLVKYNRKNCCIDTIKI